MRAAMLVLGAVFVVVPANATRARTTTSVRTAGSTAARRTAASPRINAREIIPSGPLAQRGGLEPIANSTRGTLHVATHGLCSAQMRPDAQGLYLARRDATTSYSDGNDLLARVNRSAAGALAPDYAPDDLFDVMTGRPASAAHCEPPGGQCLRHEAADALAAMLAAMRASGNEGYVHSAFRAYRAQCEVFDKWAYRERQGFCHAAEQSALAGHSQHQLGTTLDLFTRAWAHAGPVFRSGFGCSPGGRWIAEHAWEYGFVLPYPLHPDQRSTTDPCARRREISLPIDPRTGYRDEPWHVRFIGRAAAASFHTAMLASVGARDGEITLEQWLRRNEHLAGDAEVPVCDGCTCGACSTLASGPEQAGPCPNRALRLGAGGAPIVSAEVPRWISIRLDRAPLSGARAFVLDVTLDVPAGTVTQTPVPVARGWNFSPESTFASLAVNAGGTHRAYDDLPGAWRIVAEPATTTTGEAHWPWRASLAERTAAIWNGANVYLPAAFGNARVQVRIDLDDDVRTLRVAMVRDGTAFAPREVDVPMASAAR